MSRPELKDVMSEMEEPMADIGFRRRKLGVFTSEASDTVRGLVTLVAHKYSDGLRIQPFVGAQHEPLQRLVDKLEGLKYEPYSPTVAMRMGSLLPAGAFKTKSIAKGFWLLEDEDDVVHYAPQIARAIRDYGLPFIKKHSTLKGIVSFQRKHGWFERRAAAGLYLMDLPDDAFGVLEAEAKKVAEKTDGAAQDTRKFAKRLIALMQKDGWKSPAKRLAALEVLLHPKKAERMRG